LLTVTQVANTMRQAQTAGETSANAIPRLFEGEPRFPDPATAARVYGNLLGLWDLLLAGEPLEQDIAPPLGPIQRRPQNAQPPPPFPEKGPDRPWVDACFAYLEGLDKSRLDRLQHSFEHWQDVVLGCLEEHNLTDDGFDTARVSPGSATRRGARSTPYAERASTIRGRMTRRSSGFNAAPLTSDTRPLQTLYLPAENFPMAWQKPSIPRGSERRKRKQC